MILKPNSCLADKRVVLCWRRRNFLCLFCLFFLSMYRLFFFLSEIKCLLFIHVVYRLSALALRYNLPSFRNRWRNGCRSLVLRNVNSLYTLTLPVVVVWEPINNISDIEYTTDVSYLVWSPLKMCSVKYRSRFATGADGRRTAQHRYFPGW